MQRWQQLYPSILLFSILMAVSGIECGFKMQMNDDRKTKEFYVAYRLFLDTHILYVPMAVAGIICTFQMRTSND